MARFENVAELATFLGKLDTDYAEYAPALWQKGIKTTRQLANFSEPHYLACAVPEGHIDDIKARADTTGQAKAQGQTFIVSLFVPFSMENKAPNEDCQLSFDRPPSYLALLDSIEQEATSLKLEQVNFQIKAGKEYVRQDNWTRLVGDRGAIKLAIIPQKAKPLSSFTNEEGMKLLMGPNYHEAETKPFALADLKTSARLDDAVIQLTSLGFVKDLLIHLGVDLALRCLRSEPRLHSKEYAKRELISPLLYIASVLAGELEVAAEFSTKDSDAAGSVDFVVLLNSFVISVLEGKLHDTLKAHEGQLYASMHACREQYLLKKRKRDTDPMTQVPSAGILTNGTAYLFYRCYQDGQPNGQPVLTCSEFMSVDLHKGISAKSAADNVMKVVKTMVQLFVDQKKALSSFWSQKAVQ
ncbi:MAG: hypothetical protein FRX49_03894 [Trebouxia sp. A1-2]|nr:MAG: hypothetical protein FRX49_03894 [Trebouxia sp. A1-2]